MSADCRTMATEMELLLKMTEDGVSSDIEDEKVNQ